MNKDILTKLPLDLHIKVISKIIVRDDGCYHWIGGKDGI